MEGWITSIQPFSLHDGPGVRTAVFFAGCSLACRWCHNPEAISPRPLLQFFAAKCQSCGACAAACKSGCIQNTPHAMDRARCTACGACAGRCRYGALALSCRRVSGEALAEELLADAEIFRRTGGGVTFSGGEPFLQPELLGETAALLREEGVHLAVETAGNVDYKIIRELLPLFDLVLCDLKCVDDTVHREATGVSNRRILENIARLSEDAAALWVRIPLIPGVNGGEEQLRAAADFLGGLRVEKAELLPFHRLGLEKYKSLGLDPAEHDYATYTEEEAREAKERFRRFWG